MTEDQRDKPEPQTDTSGAEPLGEASTTDFSPTFQPEDATQEAAERESDREVDEDAEALEISETPGVWGRIMRAFGGGR